MLTNIFNTENLKRSHQAAIKYSAFCAAFATFAAFCASAIFTSMQLYKNNNQNQHLNLLGKIGFIHLAVFSFAECIAIAAMAGVMIDDEVHLDESETNEYSKKLITKDVRDGTILCVFFACALIPVSFYIASCVQFGKAAKEVGFANFKDPNVIGFGLAVLPFAITALSVVALCVMRGAASEKVSPSLSWVGDSSCMSQEHQCN